MALDTANATELTAEQVVKILTAPLEARSTFLAAGPRIFDTTGPLRVPAAPGAMATSGAEALAFVGENTIIPEEDHDFSEVSLLPSTMQSIKVLTRYSNELARQSVVSLEAALRDRLVTDVAARLDAQFYSAEGDGVTTPRGMFAWEGTQELPVAGPLTLDAILAAHALALAENVDVSKLRLFLRPADYIALRGIKDADERYMLQPDAQSGAVASVLGLPFTLSPRIPAGHAALGDMSAVAVARDLAPSVKVLTERYADLDQQALRVVARYDVAPLQPSAFVTFTGITS